MTPEGVNGDGLCFAQTVPVVILLMKNPYTSIAIGVVFC